MNLILDIGNTNITGRICSNPDIKFAIETNKKRTDDSYFAEIFTIASYNGLNISAISNIIIASVVPSLDRIFIDLCKKYFNISPKFLQYTDVPISINMLHPEEVGIDRLVNAYYAMNCTKKSTIIIDIGTAVTFDIARLPNIYEGGMIFPGPSLSLKALRDGTARLPEITLEKPRSIIGKTTVDAITSGVFYGYIGLVKEIVDQIHVFYKTDFDVIMTGGLSNIFDFQYESMPDLTLDGIALIWQNINSPSL